MAYRCDSSHGVLFMAELPNKIIRSLQKLHAAMRYVPTLNNLSDVEEILGLGIFSFPDCGLATLYLHRSVESPIGYFRAAAQAGW